MHAYTFTHLLICVYTLAHLALRTLRNEKVALATKDSELYLRKARHCQPAAPAPPTHLVGQWYGQGGALLAMLHPAPRAL